MKAENYFKKHGCIYGISEKFSFGAWDGYSVKFDSLDEAFAWLHKEEYDFRERSLVSKSAAAKYPRVKHGMTLQKEYMGTEIYTFKGCGGFLVEFEGDELFFDRLEDAEAFIDEAF